MGELLLFVQQCGLSYEVGQRSFLSRRGQGGEGVDETLDGGGADAGEVVSKLAEGKATADERKRLAELLTA